MVEMLSVNGGETGGNRHIEFFTNEPFSDDEKLTLLNFLMQEFGLKQPVVLRGVGSAVSMQFLVEQYIRQHAKIDLLYLDANALRDASPLQIEQLWGLLSRKGVVCIESGDDAAMTTKASVQPGSLFEPVLVAKGLSVFTRGDGERPFRSMRYQVDLFLRKCYFERKCRLNTAAGTSVPEVAVIVLTYKHEDYIAECLRSVLSQRGQFRMRVIIIDDASPDGTAQVAKSVIAEYLDERIEINFQVNTQNVGVVANLATAIRLAAGCDYLTFCEGDDFWISELRIQKHIDFLAEHPHCVLSFNSLELCDANGGARTLFEVNESGDNGEIDGHRLADNNFIGNFTACFYRGELIEIISPQLFNIYAVDWFFNLYCSQFGKIGQLKEVLSVYRQHAGGEWSSRKTLDKAIELIRLIGQYDDFLDYQYDISFQRYTSRIYGTIDHACSGREGRIELLVIDDVFPSTQSGFRYAEFTSYLREFASSLVLSSGHTIHVVEKTSVVDVVRNYRRKHSGIGCRVMHHEGGFPLRLANLVYVNFLTNAWAILSDLETARVPFMFTLYPGAGFVLNDPECDYKLKRIFDSPCFQRVIVTQQVTYDYIVNRGLCPVGKVKMIFGVVMPEFAKALAVPEKHRWGFGKSRLDICFMAHKYTRYGEDKGYDVFVNVASMLRQRHDEIYFHVVGPFDRRVIDVSTISDRIKFHGSLNPDEFDSFFLDMDIIMSPNISGKIFPGSFDGFPTASCTEAGLRGVAIFAIDEFNSANGHFNDGEDIVLIKYDLADIVDKVDRYYADPAALKAVGAKGSATIRELYSYEAQMVPRIAILREVMNNPVLAQVVQDISVPKTPTRDDEQAVSQTLPLSVWDSLRKSCPAPLKEIYRNWKRPHAS